MNIIFGLLFSSLVVMDRDEFTADDLIGSTRIKFYELLASRSLTQSTKMLLDDGRSVRLPLL